MFYTKTNWPLFSLQQANLQVLAFLCPWQDGGVPVRQKNTGRLAFVVDNQAQIRWIVTNNHEVIEMN